MQYVPKHRSQMRADAQSRQTFGHMADTREQIGLPQGKHRKGRHEGRGWTNSELRHDLPNTCRGQHCLGRRIAVKHRSTFFPIHV